MKYYSEQLDKLFESEEALNEAEAKAKAEAEEKARKAQETRTEAKELEESFKVRNAALKKYNEEFVEARNTYNKAVREARKTFEETVTKITAEKDEAVNALSRALKDFEKKHPEGYRTTLRDGDNILTVSGGGNTNIDLYKDYFNSLKVADDLFDGMLDLLRR